MNSKKKKVNMVPWRVKVYQGLPERYRLIADVAGVPVDQLVSYVLEDWTKKHKTLLLDENMPARLKKLIAGDSGSEPSK